MAVRRRGSARGQQRGGSWPATRVPWRCACFLDEAEGGSGAEETRRWSWDSGDEQGEAEVLQASGRPDPATARWFRLAGDEALPERRPGSMALEQGGKRPTREEGGALGRSRGAWATLVASGGTGSKAEEDVGRRIGRRQLCSSLAARAGNEREGEGGDERGKKRLRGRDGIEGDGCSGSARERGGG